jgi:hypothetical protein
MPPNRSALLDGTTLGREHSTEVPLFQISLTKNGEPDHILTLSPSGLRDFFTCKTMEFASEQPIAEATFVKLAGTLRIECNDDFRSAIYDTIIGATMMIVRKWHSPRSLLSLFKDLKHDPLATIDKARGDQFAEHVIATIQSEMASTRQPMRKVLNRHIEAIKEVIKPGRPDEEARNIFFEAALDIARRCGDTLALPPRDRDRELTSTPLFEFAAAMSDLVMNYGNMLLDRRGLPRGRFDRFALERDALIRRLEDTRRAILRENSNTYR